MSILKRALARLGARLCGLGTPDLHAFFVELTPVKVGRGGYTALDQYRDFKTVFGGAAGRRVLHLIVDHCEGAPVSEADAENTHRTAFRAGRRSVGLWLVKTMNAEPLERPEKGQNKE